MTVLTVRELADRLALTPLTETVPEHRVTGGYAGDLLSWVMTHARAGQAWITVMSDINTVAVAAMAQVSCVILAEGVTVSPEVCRRAEEQGVCLLSAPGTAYEVSAALAEALADREEMP